jgi:hypothetical protein
MDVFNQLHLLKVSGYSDFRKCALSNLQFDFDQKIELRWLIPSDTPEFLSHMYIIVYNSQQSQNPAYSSNEKT